MNWLQATRKRLLDDATVSGLVGVHPTDGGKSIDWDERRQGAPLPALVLRLVGDDRPQHMQGFIGFRETRVQLVASADDTATAVDIIEAAVNALAPKGTFSGVRFGRSFFENERDATSRTDNDTIHGRSVDALIWHN